MMKKILITSALFLWLGGGVARAILPADASVREPQLRRERIAVDEKYEKSMEELRKVAIQRHKDLTAGLEYPPWKCQPSGAPVPGASLSLRTRDRKEVLGHSWLIGIFSLLVIGGLFWLIKQMTREADNR
jgi:hypothetical protein